MGQSTCSWWKIYILTLTTCPPPQFRLFRMFWSHVNATFWHSCIKADMSQLLHRNSEHSRRLLLVFLWFFAYKQNGIAQQSFRPVSLPVVLISAVEMTSVSSSDSVRSEVTDCVASHGSGAHCRSNSLADKTLNRYKNMQLICSVLYGPFDKFQESFQSLVRDQGLSVKQEALGLLTSVKYQIKPGLNQD